MTPISRSEILIAITQYYEVDDLSFIETVNNITFGYKAALKAKKKKEYDTLH